MAIRVHDLEKLKDTPLNILRGAGRQWTISLVMYEYLQIEGPQSNQRGAPNP